MSDRVDANGEEGDAEQDAEQLRTHFDPLMCEDC